MRLGFIFILCIIFGHLVYSQSCHDTLMDRDLERLERINNSFDNLHAIEVADSLLLILENNNLQSCQSYFRVLLKKGESLENYYHNNDALRLYYAILKKTKELGYTQISIETYLSMARIYEANEKPEYSKAYLNFAIEKMKESGLYGSYGRYAIRNSSYHRLFGNQDTALYYANIALELTSKDTLKRIERDANLLLGMLIENTDESIEYSKRASELFKSIKSYYGAAAQNYNIGKKLRINGRPDESLIYFNLALENINALLNNDIISGYLLAKIYDQKRAYFFDKDIIDSAYYYALLSHKYEIEASHQQEENNLDRIAMQQKVLREGQKIDFLEKQKLQLQLGLLGGGILLLIVSVLLFNNYRNRKQITTKKQIIKDKNDALEASNTQKSTLLSEIHHRVKNNLQLIISLLVLQSEKSTEKSIKEELQNISNKVNSIALIHDHLYQSGEFDSILIVDYYLDMFNYFKQLKPFDYHIDCNTITLNLETLIPLGIISAELITNSLKYAGVDNLNLYLIVRKINDEYKLIFKDNGKGYEDGNLVKPSSNMGTILIQSLVRQLNGSFTTYNENGAIFEFTFKEKTISKI